MTQTFFANVKRKRKLRQEIESVIVDQAEQSQPPELSEAFRGYFNSTFSNDEGHESLLHYQAAFHNPRRGCAQTTYTFEHE